jgi:hypothetical protein
MIGTDPENLFGIDAKIIMGNNIPESDVAVPICLLFYSGLRKVRNGSSA